MLALNFFIFLSDKNIKNGNIDWAIVVIRATTQETVNLSELDSSISTYNNAENISFM